MPQNPRAGGVSRRIEGEDRDELKKVLAELNMPEGMGVIVRTAGVGRSSEEMQWDLDYLSQVWSAIEQAGSEKPAPFLIYQESDIVVRALRDHYRADVGEILIDSEKAYNQAHDFMSMVMPGSLNKLKRFEDKLPLFNRFQIENQIESAFSREVNLPSGGAIVIDHTEALTSIDVNSARATKGSDIEETAKNTNLEAADEIARQLRIRDLGGLIVIDFIDMMQNRNQREVETRLRNAVYDDRARVQIGRISRFGLLEMSRQRLRPSLEESSQIVCPRCSGQGTIRDVESLSLAVLRLLEEESLKDNTGKILAKLPVECATYLLNEKRDKVDSLEQRRGVHIVVIPDPKLETPHYLIERVKDNDTHRHESNYKKSYELTTEEEPVNLVEIATSTPANSEVAAVQRVEPSTPRPAPPPAKPEKTGKGLFGKLIELLFGKSESSTDRKPTDAKPNREPQNRGGNRNRRGGRNRGNQNRQRGNSANKGNEANKRTRSADKESGKSDSSQVKEKRKTENSESGESRRKNQPRSGRSRNTNRSGNRGNRSRNQENRPQEDSSETNESSEQVNANAQPGETGKQDSAANTSKAVASSENRQSQSESQSASKKTETEAIAEKPKAESTSEKPKAESTSEKPKAESTSENPKAESTSKKPETDSLVEKPKSASADEKPRSKPVAEKPRADAKVETPKSEPAAVPATEKPVSNEAL